MRTILVTGAAGFIGYHLSLRLLAAGWRVVGLDSLNPYYDPALKRARLAQLEATRAIEAACGRKARMRMLPMQPGDAPATGPRPGSCAT